MGGILSKGPHDGMEKNPLLNSVVLNQIFSHLKVRDLKKCRLVCSLWNAEVLASTSWKRSANVWLYHIFNERTTKDFMKLLEEGSYLGSMANYEARHNQKLPICEAFWEHCGHYIKSLTMYAIKFRSEDDFRTAVYKACPNMEELSLGGIEIIKKGSAEAVEPVESVVSSFPEHRKLKSLAIRSTSFWDKDNSGVSWTELFGHFPHLTSLEVVGDVGINYQDLFRSFRKLRRQNPAHLQLQKFAMKQGTYKVPLRPFSSIFAVLKDTGLQLESIELSEMCAAEDLKEILELHAASLKKLKLNGGFPEEGHSISDPYDVFPLANQHGCLEALHELKLTKDSFRSLGVLKFMPNLKRLKIDFYTHTSGIRPEWLDMEGILAKNCKELKIRNHNLSVKVIEKLICWIPNLEKLEISNAENSHFEKICEGWPHLFTLILNCCRIDDCGISGLDENDVDRINRFGDWSSWRPITVPRANITSLKDLKGFYMEGNAVSEIELGYCAAKYGIEQLSNLQDFHVDKLNRQGQLQRRLDRWRPGATLANYVVLFLLLIGWIGNFAWEITLTSMFFAKMFIE